MGIIGTLFLVVSVAIDLFGNGEISDKVISSELFVGGLVMVIGKMTLDGLEKLNTSFVKVLDILIELLKNTKV